MKETDIYKTDRYPGLWSFRNDQSDIFFGRDREKEDLFHHIRSSQVVVVFSKSGLGKSSLLDAGVSPLLRTSGYFPITVRFRKTTNEATSQVSGPVEILKASLNQFNIKSEIIFDATHPRLWEFMKTCTCPDAAIPVLLFDQFEEFFQFSSNEINDFLLQLSELIHDRPPSRITDWLLQIETTERTPQQVAWASQPDVKFVFVIRSDRLSELQKVDDFIPTVLSNRYELQAMKETNARSAIEKPAKIEGNDRFESPAFTYTESTLQKILTNLRDERTGEIESSQLQIVCKFIEDKIKDAAKNGQPITTVDEKVFNADAEIDMVLRNFYENQLASVGNEEEKNLCRMVLEEYLLADGRRASLLETQIKKLLKNNDLLLQKLLAARLIKVENTHLGTTYEISHDSLVDPIMKSKQEREEREGRSMAKQKQLAEAEANVRNHFASLINNDHKAALKFLENAIAIYDKYADQLKGKIEARIYMAKLLESENKLDEAIHHLQDTHAIAIQGNDESLIGRVCETFASVYEKKEDVHLSYEYYKDALKKYETVKDYPQAARLAEHLGGIKEELYDALIGDDSLTENNGSELIINESNEFYSRAAKYYNLLGDRIGTRRAARSQDRIIRYIKPWGYLTELFSGDVHHLKGKSPVLVGRDVYDEETKTFKVKNEVGFSNRYMLISRRHMTITPELVIEDTQSKNGSTINTLPLYYGNPRSLTDGDIVVLANIMPLLFTINEPAQPVIPNECWGIIVDGTSKSNYYLSGYNQSYSVIIRINADIKTNQNAPYKIDIQAGESEDAIIIYKCIDLQPSSIVNEKMMLFEDKLGSWEIQTTVKDTDRFYKDYILTTDAWFPAVDFPLQPRLILNKKMEDQNQDTILAYGPTFQLILHPDINPAMAPQIN